MRRIATLLSLIMMILAMLTPLRATAQETATPPPVAVLVTVVLVTHTPTPTHTSTPGDTPTVTPTPTATYLSAMHLPPAEGGTYGGQIDLSMTAGEVVIIVLLTMLVTLLMLIFVRRGQGLSGL